MLGHVEPPSLSKLLVHGARTVQRKARSVRNSVVQRYRQRYLGKYCDTKRIADVTVYRGATIPLSIVRLRYRALQVESLYC